MRSLTLDGRLGFFGGFQISAYDNPVLDFDTVKIRGESKRGSRLVHDSDAQVGCGFLFEFRDADGLCDGAVVPEGTFPRKRVPSLLN